MKVKSVILHFKTEKGDFFEHEATLEIANGCLSENIETAVVAIAETVGYPINEYGMRNPQIKPKEKSKFYIATWISHKGVKEVT